MNPQIISDIDLAFDVLKDKIDKGHNLTIKDIKNLKKILAIIDSINGS